MRRILSRIVAIIAIILLFSGAVVGLEQAKRLNRLVETEATPLSIISIKGRLAMAEGQGPIVQLRLPTGERADATLDLGLADAFDYRLEARVPVLYDPADPTRALLNDPVAVWGQSALTAGLGLFLLIVSFLIAPGSRRQVTGRRPAARPASAGGQAAPAAAAPATAPPEAHMVSRAGAASVYRPIVMNRTAAPSRAVVRGGERTMSMRLIVLIIVLLLVAAGAGFYFTVNGDGSPGPFG